MRRTRNKDIAFITIDTLETEKARHHIVPRIDLLPEGQRGIQPGVPFFLVSGKMARILALEEKVNAAITQLD